MAGTTGLRFIQKGLSVVDTKMKKWFVIVNRGFDLAEKVVVYGVPGLVFYKCVEVLSGQETVVKVAVDYFSKGGNFWPWAATIGCSGWAIGERKFRHAKISKMSRHINELEKRLHPGRTSSGLTKEGKTPSNNKK